MCVCVCGAQSMIHLIVTNGAVKRSESEPFNVIWKPKMSRLLRHRGTKDKRHETLWNQREDAQERWHAGNRTKQEENTQKNNNSNWNTRTQCITHVLLYLVNICRTADCAPPPLKPGSPAAPPPGLHKSLFLKPHFNKIPPKKNQSGEFRWKKSVWMPTSTALIFSFFSFLLPCIKK